MSWKPEYVVLIVLSTLVDYVMALAMEKTENKRKRKLYLSISLLTNLGLLFAFKYFNFVSNSIADVLDIFSIQFSQPTLNVLLPVGISFYTFQTLSYTIDVYKRKITAERHFGIFAVYVSFFPQLVAGPIERAKNLLPQFFVKQSFNYERVVSGLRLMLWGFFKKIVIADGLAVFVDRIFGNVTSYSGISLILATVFFSFQIYCDFSGYSDIAIGAARVMGFKLMDNFKAPYLAKSIADFWRRWHISLSTWFQDYLFTPLYFKASKIKRLKNFSTKKRHLIAFAISMIIGEALLGLWHGANWTFLFFGLWHGLFIIIYYIVRKTWDRLYTSIQILLTFSISTFGWIFFRSNSIADALYIIEHMFKNSQFGFFHDLKGFFLHNEYEFAVMILPLLIVFFAHFIQKRYHDFVQFLETRSTTLRWSLYYFLIMAILLFGTFGSREFIYFNF